MLPLIKKANITPILQEVFPELDFNPVFKKIPKRSRKFFYRLDFLWMIPVAAAVSYFFYPFGLFSLLLFPLSYSLGIWQHNTAGFYMNERQLVIQYRLFSKTIVWMEKRRIQSMTESTTIFQKRASVSSVITTIKSGVTGAPTTIPHVEKTDAEMVLNWYEPQRKTTIEKEQPIE